MKKKNGLFNFWDRLKSLLNKKKEKRGNVPVSSKKIVVEELKQQQKLNTEHVQEIDKETAPEEEKTVTEAVFLSVDNPPEQTVGSENLEMRIEEAGEQLKNVIEPVTNDVVEETSKEESEGLPEDVLVEMLEIESKMFGKSEVIDDLPGDMNCSIDIETENISDEVIDDFSGVSREVHFISEESDESEEEKLSVTSDYDDNKCSENAEIEEHIAVNDSENGDISITTFNGADTELVDNSLEEAKEEAQELEQISNITEEEQTEELNHLLEDDKEVSEEETKSNENESRYVPIVEGKNVAKSQGEFIDGYRENDEDY